MLAAIRLLHVPEGAELVEWLVRTAGGTSSAWVQAVGRLESVELDLGGQPRTLNGPLALASLTGAVGGPYGVVLSRVTDTGLETVSGLLVRARALGVRVAILPCIAETGAPLQPAPSAEASAEDSRSAEASGWAAVANSAAGSGSEEEDDPVPEPGDLVQHFAFGLCEVLMSDGETLKIRDVRATGRIREIRVDVLDVSSPSIRNGKRLFKLTRRA